MEENKNIKITEFYTIGSEPADVLKMGDSMLEDSGVDIVWGKIDINDEKDVEFSIGIRGCVKVVFKDDVYKCASQMPKELLDLIETGEINNASEAEILENNWYEIFIGDESDVMEMNPNEFRTIGELKDYIVYNAERFYC